MSFNHDQASQNYKVDLSRLQNSKLRFGREVLQQFQGEGSFPAIVKVAKEHYQPPGVEIRAWVSPSLFTATIRLEMLDGLECDPLVVGIEPAFRLRSS